MEPRTVNVWAAASPKAALEPITVEAPPLGPNGVEVAVTHCGLCGSDVHLINSDGGYSDFTAYGLGKPRAASVITRPMGELNQSQHELETSKHPARFVVTNSAVPPPPSPPPSPSPIGDLSDAAADSPTTKPIILWAPPRSTSTAFERALMQHRSIAVYHEQLADCFYFGPDRKQKPLPDAIETGSSLNRHTSYMEQLKQVGARPYTRHATACMLHARPVAPLPSRSHPLSHRHSRPTLLPDARACCSCLLLVLP